VAVWVRTSKTGQQGVVSGARAGNDNEFLLFFASSTEIRVYTGINDSSFVAWTVPSVADDGWHHLAVTRDVSGSSVELFLDGVSQGAQTVSLTALSIDPGGLVLAQDQDSVGVGFTSAQAFSGSLDEVRFYTRVLTPTEISALANE